MTPPPGRKPADWMWELCKPQNACVWYQVGTCQYMNDASKCKYKHTTILPPSGAAAAKAKAKARAKKGAKSPSPKLRATADKLAKKNGGKVPLCTDLVKGRCQYGNNCPFSHQLAKGSGAPAAPASDTTAEVAAYDDDAEWDEYGWDQCEECGCEDEWGPDDWENVDWSEDAYWRGEEGNGSSSSGADLLGFSAVSTPNV